MLRERGELGEGVGRVEREEVPGVEEEDGVVAVFEVDGFEAELAVYLLEAVEELGFWERGLVWRVGLGKGVVSLPDRTCARLVAMTISTRYRDFGVVEVHVLSVACVSCSSWFSQPSRSLWSSRSSPSSWTRHNGSLRIAPVDM